MHTPRTITSRRSSTIGETPPARITHRGRSQMSPREAALAPMVTPEELMASLEDLDAELGKASGHNTPSASHHPESPGQSLSNFQPLLAQHELPWDTYGCSAAYGLDLRGAGSTSDNRPSTARATLPKASTDQMGPFARELLLPFETEQERRELLYRKHLRWALIAGSAQRRDGRIDCAQLLRDILANNQPLYNANVSFDERPKPMGVNV